MALSKGAWLSDAANRHVIPMTVVTSLAKTYFDLAALVRIIPVSAWTHRL